MRIRAALKKRVNELFGERAAEALPYLLHLAGVKLEGEPAERIGVLDGETLKRQILITIAGYFERLAQTQPTVVIFEDLHWADPSSLEALEQLLAVTDRAPLMLLLISRLERELPPGGSSLRLRRISPTVIPKSCSSPCLQASKTSWWTTCSRWLSCRPDPKADP